MKKRMKRPRLTIHLLLPLVLALLALALGAYYLMHQSYHVLVIFSESRTHYEFTDYPDLLQRELQRNGMVRVELSTAYLRCEVLGPKQELDEVKRILDETQAKRPIDMVLLIGDQATYSTLSSSHPLVRKVPVVFGGVRFPNWKLLQLFPNVTGFSDEGDVAANIRVAKQLTGNGNTYTLIDLSAFMDRQTFYLMQRQVDADAGIINNLDRHLGVNELVTQYTDSCSLSSLALRNLGINTKVGETIPPEDLNFISVISRYNDLIFLQMKSEGTAISLVRFSNYNPMVTGICMGFGAGGTSFIGGYFASVEDIAADVASRAARILRGASPGSFSVVDSPKHYYLDWQVARNFQYDVDHLPEGYRVVNLPWWERHYVLFPVLVVLGLLVLAAVLIVLTTALRRERRLKREALLLAEHENALYNMSVHENQAYVWERVGDTVHISSALWQHFGLLPRDISVYQLEQFIHPDHRVFFRDSLRHRPNREIFTNHLQIDFVGNGDYHWYKVSGQFDCREEEDIVRRYGMITNIDDFKQREQELAESRRMAEEATLKESFLANMSHEIRTPLNAIVGFSSILLDPDMEITDEEKQMYSETIQTNNELLLKLINDILDLSRVESGAMEFHVQPCSVRALMEQEYRTFQVQMPSHLEFRLVQPEPDATIQTDPGRLSQVLGNFLTNAGKFTPQGYVELGWQLLPDRLVELYVQDSGIGLSEEECKMVFSRFYKKNEFKQGTGLGLSICKAIVIRLGGTIRATSTPGQGSRFSVCFRAV